MSKWNLKIIDSFIFRLFSEILRGVGRNRLDGALQNGRFNVHSKMDAFSGVTEFVRWTEAQEHDRKVVYHLRLTPNTRIVFNKAYTAYGQFVNWNAQQVWFVTRGRRNADFHMTIVMVDKTRRQKARGV